MPQTISALFVVRNEQARIGPAIRAAQEICSQVVVIDQSSSDLTQAVVASMGVACFIDKAHGYCEASRLLGAYHCRCDWILVLDADERPSPELVANITSLVEGPFDGYRLKKRFVLGGKEMFVGGEYRLFRNGCALFINELHTEPQPQGKIGPTPEWAGIIHEKTRQEQREDDARYEALISASDRPESWKAARRALIYSD